jgi:hypothetical protein
MRQLSIESDRRSRRRQSVSAQVTYVIFCGAMLVGLAGLTATGFMLPPPAAIVVEPPREGPAQAKIQLYSDRGQDVCRNLVFHNDSGRVDEGGYARCRGLIPDEMIVETVVVRGRRMEAIARAFKFR